LRVVDLHRHFKVVKSHGWGAETLRAVNGVSLRVRRRETVGLVGESGCGKSTLGRTIAGLQEATEGAVYFDGADVGAMSPRRRMAYRRRMQVVFQDPYASLDPRMTVHEIVAEPLRINGVYDAARVAQMLEFVGLSADAQALRPAAFSGGQRQRIAIARALALNPELLILDEAVSALDVSIQAQIVNLLDRLQRELGLSYLFISHDLSVIRYVSHRVAVMYLGRIVEMAPTDALFARPLHPYTQSLLSAVPTPDPARRSRGSRIVLKGDLPNPLRPPSGCVFRTRCFKARPICESVAPPLEAGGTADHLAACHFPGPPDVTG
jgi:oligopeptide/dipeptide ABC transporter ATP-binding protein